MKKLFLKIKTYVLKHKVRSLIILIIFLALLYGLVAFLGEADTQILYTTGKVSRGSITTTVSGSGQVYSTDEVELKAEATGDITYLNAKAGQEVSSGALLVQLDNGDVAYELESALIEYDELVTVDPQDLQKAKEAVSDAEEDVINSYVDAGVSLAVSSASLSDNLDTVDGFFDDYLNSAKTGLSNTEREYIFNVEKKYSTAHKSLTEFLKKYRLVSSEMNYETTELLLSDLSKTSSLVLEVAKSAKDAVVYLRNNEDDPSVANSTYIEAVELLTAVNTTVTDLIVAYDDITIANRTLRDAKTSLVDLEDGPDTLDLRTQQLAVKQKREELSNYSVTAPFSGLIASVEVNKGDTVNNGDTVVTLITKEKLAEISLNEVDAASVKIGQKANLTFDAIDGLSIVGTVSEIDSIGTVSQGVVSYSAKISFDTQDDRIKSGMSVSASIVTENKKDILIVPASAIKSLGDNNYVEVFDAMSATSDIGQAFASDSAPKKQMITVGISDDTNTEIITGLTEGQIIIIKTIITEATNNNSSASFSFSSLFGGNRNNQRNNTTTSGTKTTKSTSSSSGSGMGGSGMMPPGI